MTLFRFLRGMIATAVLVAIVAGFPILLYQVAGSPFPRTTPSLEEILHALMARDDGTLFINAVELVAWSAWALFSFSVGWELLAKARGLRIAPQLPGLGGMQRMAAYLVASAALAVSVPTAVAADSPAPPVVAMAPLHPLGKAAPHDAVPVYRVRQGDTLAEIADAKLGSPRKWPQIWKLNAHSRQPDGRVFTDPDVIHPRWELRLPAKESPQPAQASRSAPPSTPKQSAPEPSAPPRPPTPDIEQGQDQLTDGAVALSTGSLVAVSYAAGISTAFAANRLRRRRRRLPPPTGEPVTPAPEPAPEPAVQELRLAHRQAAKEQGGKPASDADLMREAYSIDVPQMTAIGRRADGSLIEVDIAGPGLGLVGPGSRDVARYMVLDLLRQSRDYRAEVIMSVELAESLLGVPAEQLQTMTPALPSLALTADAGEALKRLAEVYFTRRRMLLERDVSDIGKLRDRDPGEVLPAVLLVTELNDDAFEVGTAPLASAETAGVSALILGEWPGGTTCTVGQSHVTEAAEGQLADIVEGAQLFHITREEAAAHLRELAPATDAECAPEPPLEPSGEEWPGPQLIRLSVLGPLKVHVRDRAEPLELSWLQQNLLAYLALHPDGVTREQLTTALWPDETGKDVHNTLRHLRAALVAATGYVNPDSKKAPFINASTTKDSATYRIDPQLVRVDLWDFQLALEQVRQAETRESRRAALAEAAALSKGALADGLESEWIDDHRYPLTRSQADLLSQYAEELATEAPERAIEALEHARVLDPDAEETYLRIVRLQLGLGRRDDARRTAQLLRQRHQALGVPLDTRTEKLLAQAFGLR
ncbi:LysM peptidoglycan-binding domain-containing protein, partial [Nonomuraea sp. RK-328]|nr:LysM peptidoglycan-binding domain-containing protein [Nonomuraea sp. RK-328]